MTTIYIDTNIVFTESFFCSPWAQSFLKACALLQISVVVPEVVLDEIKGNFPARLDEKIKAFRKAEKSLSKLIDVEHQELDFPALVDEYENFLDDLLDECGVIVAPYPEISAQQLVQNSYQGQKPFKARGDGHKDFIVWETIKAFIQSGANAGPHILMTNNVKDFAESAGQDQFVLHPQLAGQLAEGQAIPEIQRSMKSVLEATIMPLLEGMVLEDIPDLNQQDIEHMTNTILLDDLPQRTVFGFENVPFSNEVSICSVGEAAIKGVNLAKADDQIVIKIVGTVEIEVDGFMEKFELYHQEEEADFYVVDGNWNDHVAAVAATVETEFELSVFYSLTDKKVIGHEIVLPQETDDPWPYG